MILTGEPLFEEAPGSWLSGLLRMVAAYSVRVGRCTRLAWESILYIPAALCRREGRAATVEALYTTGIRTLPVVSVVALFTGMILGLQVGLQLAKFNQESYLGAAVMASLLREMGPFVTGVCLSACVGSRIAAELGTMTVNDEVAALEIMSVNPVRYLVSPRMTGLLVMSPLLSFYACVLGCVGGGLVAYTQLNVDFRQFIASALSISDLKDLFTGLFKATGCGLVIGAVSCHEGFATRNGATGVGRSTQRCVIIAFVLILMLGYMADRFCYF